MGTFSVRLKEVEKKVKIQRIFFLGTFLVRLKEVEGDYWRTPGVHVRVYIQVYVRVHISATVHGRIIQPGVWMHHG